MGNSPNLFFKVTLSFENLSSGEKRAAVWKVRLTRSVELTEF